MRSFWFLSLPLALAALVLVPARRPADAALEPDKDRSPADVAVSHDARFALTANNTSDSVSLVDLTAGKVSAEIPVGQRPFDVALRADEKQALVTNSWSNSVTVLNIMPNNLTMTRAIPVGDTPRGIAYSKDGATAYVALAGESAVAMVDVRAGKVVKKWSVDDEPWHLTLTPDGKRLIVGCSRGRTVCLLNATTGKSERTIKVLGRNLRHIAVEPNGKWAYVPTISERKLGVTRPNIDRGWVVGNRLTRVPLDTPEGDHAAREAMTLDTQGNAVADVDGLSIRPDGKQIALTAGGTHELLLMRLPDLNFIAYGGPGDHIEPELLADSARFRRVKLGGRPLGATYTPDGKSIVVANYLSNSVQVVDAATGKLTQTIPLGGPKEPSLARRGEAIFLDGDRSFNSWYSCNSCHTEGDTNGGSFDTLNDGGLGKPKKTLSLRGVALTPPYTWHGWNPDLKRALHDSLVNTMQGKEPTDDDIAAVEAYVKTLTWRKSPYLSPEGTLTAIAKRGRSRLSGQKLPDLSRRPKFHDPPSSPKSASKRQMISTRASIPLPSATSITAPPTCTTAERRP